MNRLLLLLVAILAVLSAYLGYELHVCSSGVSPKGDLTVDLQQVQSDLMVQKACSNLSMQKPQDVSMQRGNMNSQMKTWRTDSTHYGILCFEDVCKMMLENVGPKGNNAIVIYPVLPDPSNPASATVVYRGANYSLDGTTLEFSPSSNHYFSSWCPAICPRSVIGDASPTVQVVDAGAAQAGSH